MPETLAKKDPATPQNSSASVPPEEELQGLLERRDYPAAAHWVLQRCHGPGKLSVGLRQQVENTLAQLRARGPALSEPPLPPPARQLENAFERVKTDWLEREHPCGFGGVPELGSLRRQLLGKGKAKARMPLDTDFAALEAQVRDELEREDRARLISRLDPRHNPYSCAYFEHLTALRLSGRQGEREVAIDEALVVIAQRKKGASATQHTGTDGASLNPPTALDVALNFPIER